MFNRLKSVLNHATLEEQTGLSREELQEWREKETQIGEWWDWFTGKTLEEVDEEHPEKPLLNPLQINPIASVCRLHAYALAGETPDTADPLVKTLLEPRDQENESDKAAAQHAENILTQVAYENGLRSMGTDMFLSIQALGAMVLKVGWEKDSLTRPLGIRYEAFDPRYFWCHWSGSKYEDLTAAWLKFTVSQATAREYGIDLKTPTGTFVEYWDKQRFWIKIDGQVAKDPDGKPYLSDHGFGFVPFVYIPHERANDFWGRSLVPEGIGLVRELNSRLADVGDAVHLGVNSLVLAKNIKHGYPVEKTLPNGQPYIDLGRSISSGEPEPDMWRADPPELPQGADKFNSQVIEWFNKSQHTPDIAFGHEEGSQRSGQTLYNRMWPMLSHVRTERTYWSDGLNLLAEMTLRILALKKMGGITREHLGLRKRQVWAPMVPVDRQALVEEIIRRLQEGGISRETALERFGDIPDVIEELRRIEELETKAAELEAKSRPQPKPGTPNAAV